MRRRASVAGVVCFVDPEGRTRLEAARALRRRLNDDRLRLFGRANRTIAFVCECADPGCSKTVLLGEQEYDARRRVQGLILHESHEPGLLDSGPLQ